MSANEKCLCLSMPGISLLAEVDKKWIPSFNKNLIPQNSKRFSDSEESTNPAVRVTERKS